MNETRKATDASKARRAAIAALLGLLCAIVAAVASPPPAPAQSTAGTVLRFGWAQEPDNLNPFVGQNEEDYTIWSINWDLPIGYDPKDLSPTSGIVDTWEVSEDRKTVTMKLERGMRWSDGEPITSEDVKWSLENLGEEGVLFAGYTSGITRIETPDARTIVIETKRPDARIIGGLYIYVLPEHVWGDVPMDELTGQYKPELPMVGSGPYIVTEYEKGRITRMERNPEWQGEQGATLWMRRGTLRAAAEDATPVERDRAQMSPAAQSDARRALRLYAVAGGIALGYEIVWSQVLVQFMSTRSFAFAVMLASYLAGLVLGSALYARHADRVRDPWGAFGLLLSAAGLLSLLLVAGLGAWLPALQETVAGAVRQLGAAPKLVMSANFATAAICVVLLPTLLLGAAFPAALRLAVDVRHVGRDSGRVLALNTLGGIAGSLLAGFVLVPWLGLIQALAVLALGAAGVGLWAVLPSPQMRSLPRLATLALCAVTAAAAVLTPRDRLAGLLATARGGELNFYEESRGGTVAVLEQRSRGGNQFHRLYIDGVSNSGDALTSQRYMRLQALLPLIVHDGEPKSALVIGLGTGITAGALLSDPGLQQRVVAELLPAVQRAAPRFDGNQGVANDARIDMRLRDGRRELLASEQRYDLITLEPPPPSAAGVANLYSTDFYRLAGRRLQANGIVAQWLPLPTQNDEDTRALVRSFIDVFPHASLWTTELHEMLLIGSFQPLTLDYARIAARFAQPGIAAALREVGVASPAALLATWVTDRDGLARYAGNTAPVTDDRPRIEYAQWVRPREVQRVLPKLIALHTPVPLQGADDAARRDVERERDRLMVFYEAGLYAYAGDRNNAMASLRYVMQRDGSNPYYRWVAGTPRQEAPGAER